MESIDNDTHADVIDRTFDVFTWNEVADFVNLAEESLTEEDFDIDLQYQSHEIFWRKLETQAVDFENGARLIDIYCRVQPDEKTN